MTERIEHKRHHIYNVQPLRTKKAISDMRAALMNTNGKVTNNKTGIRNVMLFNFGINTGLRVSDIVKLHVRDVQGKNHLIMREKKTGKARDVYIANLKDDLTKYIKAMDLDPSDWLFPSRQGNGHITTTQVYRALVKAGKLCGRNDIGTHSMRKTFGYWYWKRTGDIATLMQIFNHSSEAITKRYIGIKQENIDQSLKDFKL